MSHVRRHIQSFFPRGDKRVKLVEQFVHDLAAVQGELSPLETWIPDENAVPTILANEVHHLLHVDDDPHFDANFRARSYYECTLERRSIYRTVEDYLSEPLGLCAEPLVWSNLGNFRCPVCNSSDIRLGGGSSTAWADLVCRCQTLFEVKTVGRGMMRMVRKNQMRGGSYKYFKAQERNGMKHYMIIVPKDGGDVLLKKIKYVNPKVDAKFMCFYKHAPEHASLRSHVVLYGGNQVVYTGDDLRDYNAHCKRVAKKLVQLSCSRFARTIQRFFKRYYLPR